MEMTFLNAAGTVLFVRSDMEQGNWTQEEYTVNATFPYNAGKVIERGQILSFIDPATEAVEMFEIRNVTNIEPEHYQQIIAEHIAVSELSDEHCNTAEITGKTAKQALTSVLTGTLWSVGTGNPSGTQNVDIARGSVWQAVNNISQNWNVYITPRVTVNDAGSITGRYLDISPAQGTWRGVRLSIDKNMSDSSVVYDDSEVLTALYGYGGAVEVENPTTYNTTTELTFADIVWSETSAHPAKPLNQTYIEDPAKTALYGRNGRARFGFYQNGDIDDAETLLEKTWEALKQTSEPKISITGTVSDLYRLGYKDQPLRLHDTVIVEIRQTGEKFQKEIIKIDVDLIDPTATRPEIGSYIPNIIYIDRDTENIASGGGGGGGRGQTNEEKYQYDTYSGFEKRTDEYGSMIAMVVGKYNGNQYIKAGEIGLSINQSGESGSYESTAYINANHVNISATNTAYTLAGDLEHDANGRLVIKNAGGMYVERTDQGTTAYYGVWDDGNISSGMVVSKINGRTSTKIIADYVDIAGIIQAINTESGTRLEITADQVAITGSTTLDSFFSSSGGSMTFSANRLSTEQLSVSNGQGFSYDGRTVSWRSATIVTDVGVTMPSISRSDLKPFIYATSSGGTTAAGSETGRVITSYTAGSVSPTTDTIYFLGGNAPQSAANALSEGGEVSA